MSERIQKLLATAGIASRRAIEEWIAEGRITVNGRPAEVGQKIDYQDHVRVDGRLVALTRKAGPVRVILFRKKTGELVTRDDPDGRRTVFRKLPELETGRWIAVGRLDINTSGLLLMTTDGELARRLTHPSFEITRTYAVRVLGEMTAEIRKRLLTGVTLDDGPAKCETLVSADPPEAEDAEGAANRWYEVTMREGRNRIVRRIFEGVDMQVSRLIRIAYGPVQLGRGIKAGSYREATEEELHALMQAVKLEVPAVEAVKRAPRSALAKKFRPMGGKGTRKPAAAGGPRKSAAGDSRKPAAGGSKKPATGGPRNPAPVGSKRPESGGPRKPAPGGSRKPASAGPGKPKKPGR